MLKKTFITLGLGTLVLGGLSFTTLASCSSDDGVDYVSQTKLDVDYKGKNFIRDGIGKVTLRQGIDGDTAHFYDDNGTTIIKGRFIGVDTPESTGQLQPWGHGAKVFTTEKLKNAKTIVLESEDPTKPAEKDSTGTRYKCFVWVSDVENGDITTFKMINLWLVQEGWSAGKGISGSKYANTFTEADLQAQKEKLHIWSDGKDPDFNYADPVECDLQLINEGKIKKSGETSYSDYDWNENKVTIKGIVCDIRGTDCWVNLTFNNELTGGVDKTYGMYVFTMYKSYPPLLHIGNLVQLTGTITAYMGNYQMVDVYWSRTSKDPDNIQLLESKVETPVVDVEAKDITRNSETGKNYLNVVVNCVTPLYATGCKVTETSSGYTIGAYLTDLERKTELYLYVDDQVHLKNDEGVRLTSKDDVMAFLGNKNDPFKVRAPITIFTSEDGSYTNYDLCYTGTASITFLREETK